MLINVFPISSQGIYQSSLALFFLTYYICIFFFHSKLNGAQRLTVLKVDNLIEVVNNFLRKSSNMPQPSRCLIKICCSLIKSTTSLIARLTETRAASWVRERERHLIALKGAPIGLWR